MQARLRSLMRTAAVLWPLAATGERGPILQITAVEAPASSPEKAALSMIDLPQLHRVQAVRIAREGGVVWAPGLSRAERPHGVVRGRGAASN